MKKRIRTLGKHIAAAVCAAAVIISAYPAAPAMAEHREFSYDTSTICKRRISHL